MEKRTKDFIANDRHSIYCISNGLHQDRLFRKNSQERILQQLEVKHNFFTRDSSVHKIEHNLINNNHVYTQEKWRSLQRIFNKKNARLIASHFHTITFSIKQAAWHILSELKVRILRTATSCRGKYKRNLTRELKGKLKFKGANMTIYKL
jgi:chromatin segregation and condensation protein Rec8/ScpA/Scc1 (kleisin family)